MRLLPEEGTFGDGWLRPRRSRSPEIMEQPDAPPVLVEGSLGDLDRINGLPGGHGMTLLAIEKLLRRTEPEGGLPPEFSVLDVACGGASLALEIVRWAEREGVVASVLATDSGPGILRVAEASVAATDKGAGGGIDFALADALNLPFEDDSFDVVTISFALHHFGWAEAARVLSEMRRVSRRGAVVNDLVRSWIGAAGSRAFIPLLTRNSITRHDGVVSAGAAFTRSEMERLARTIGANDVRYLGVPGYRVVMTFS